MDILLALLFTIIFLVLIKKLRFFNSEKISFTLLSILFIAKVLSGIFMILVYTYYYTDRSTADIFKYFDDGNILFSALFNNPKDYFKMLSGIGSNEPHLMEYYDKMGFWIKSFNYNLYNDNRTLIRFNAFVRLFSFGSIYVHIVIINFLSFSGLFALYKTFISGFKNQSTLLLLFIVGLPSVVFWGSGILKEGILLFALGFLVYTSYSIINNKLTLKHIIILFGAIFILLLSKFYVLIALIPGFIYYIWQKKSSIVPFWLKFLITHVFVIIITVQIHYLLPKYDLVNIIVQKQHDFEQMIAENGTVGSYYSIPKLEHSVWNILKNSPQGIINSFSRPHIFEAKSPFMLLSAFENLFLIILFICTLFFFTLKKWDSAIILQIISFVIILFALTGITTPVLGALVRYRLPALPFLMVMFLYFFDIEKFKNLLYQLKIIKK